jgi:hypothetical protein
MAEEVQRAKVAKEFEEGLGPEGGCREDRTPAPGPLPIGWGVGGIQHGHHLVEAPPAEAFVLFDRAAQGTDDFVASYKGFHKMQAGERADAGEEDTHDLQPQMNTDGDG